MRQVYLCRPLPYGRGSETVGRGLPIPDFWPLIWRERSLVTAGKRKLASRFMKLLWTLLLLPVIMPVPGECQTTGNQTSSSQTPPSVSAEWDVSPTLDALSAQARRLKPILDQLTPQEWVAKGAPDTYVLQWKRAQDELGYLVDSAKAVEKQPERLTLALDTYFRLQSLEARLNSLVEGVRNYQNPAVGDLLMGVLAENSANRDKLRQYITDLAATKEQEFQIVDKEAQRCRGVLTQQTPKPATKKQN
jgi:hypothetical protein